MSTAVARCFAKSDKVWKLWARLQIQQVTIFTLIILDVNYSIYDIFMSIYSIEGKISKKELLVKILPFREHLTTQMIYEINEWLFINLSLKITDQMYG